MNQSGKFKEGDWLPPLRHTPSTVQLFRYSAVTWNAHRIHYDQDYARFEGHADVLVHSHLHAALVLRMVTEGLGSGWSVEKVSYRMRHSSVPGTELTESGQVKQVDGNRLVIAVSEHDVEGNLCLEGLVTVVRL